MSTFRIIAGRAFAVDALDAAVLKRIHDVWDAEDYDGMMLFLDEWANMLTFETAKEIIENFDLQKKLGDPATLEDRYIHVDDVFYDIEDALNNGDVKDELNRKSALAKIGGPEYTAGRDGLKFGLTFHASSKDLEDLRKRFPKQEVEEEERVEKTEDAEMAEEIEEAAQEVEKELGKAASVTAAAPPYPSSWCTQKAINLIKSVDFGYNRDAGIVALEQADNLLETCGTPNGDLKMAIRYFMTDRRRSREHIYGTESGSTVGALAELINSVELPVAASAEIPRFVTFRGALYELEDAPQHTETATEKLHQAYNLPPEKMKGVKTCTPKDQDDKKPKGEQVWCVFDSHGKLRARYKTETQAKRYKVFMINRYWSSGKGKKRSDRPTNK